jgi:hypothetical protein
MEDDRSLSDIIRFLDPSGDISDADVASITKDLKFTEVLDLIAYVSKDDMSSARGILQKHDGRFATGAEEESQQEPETVTKEYSTVPTVNRSGFKPIKPTPTIAGTPTNPNPQQKSDDDSTTDMILNDPRNQNKPEVRQIKSLLQRMSQR